MAVRGPCWGRSLGHAQLSVMTPVSDGHSPGQSLVVTGATRPCWPGPRGRSGLVELVPLAGEPAVVEDRDRLRVPDEDVPVEEGEGVVVEPRCRRRPAARLPVPSERVPATTFFLISHSRVVAAVDADADARRRRCSRATSPIDISLIVIPRRLVPCTRLPPTMTIESCVTIPSLPPETSQPSTALIPSLIEYEMSIALRERPARRRPRSRWIITCDETDVDAVQLRADDRGRCRSSRAGRSRRRSRSRRRAPSGSRISTPLARTTIPPRTTAPGLPFSTSWCVITIGPWWTPAPSVTTGGRVANPTAPAAKNSTATSGGRGRARPPELAAVLGVGEPQPRAAPTCPSSCASSHAAQKNAIAGPSGARTCTASRERRSRARARAPRAAAPPSPAGSRRRGRRRAGRARARPRPSAPRPRPATSGGSRAPGSPPPAPARARRRAASRSGPSACTTCLDPPQEAVRRVLRADERVGGRDRPTARRRPTSAERPLARPSARARVQSGSSTIHAPCVSSPCVVDEPREQRVVPRSRAGTPSRR